MKVTLVEPSFAGTHGYGVIFPFGYASLGAVLQREGHEVDYVFPAAGRLTVGDVIDYISHIDTGLIGIGGLLPYLPAVIDFVKKTKAVRPDIPVVVGGQMVTHTPQLVLGKTGADFCIAGEGEVPLLRLVNCLQRGDDFSDIHGLFFLRDGLVIGTGLGAPMPLESIPMPNWNDFPMDYYMYAGPCPSAHWDTGPRRSFTWLLSRGCPMKCNFCTSGCEPRHKTIAQSVIELQEIVDRFRPDYVIFADNFFTRNREYTIELCEAFLANGFRFEFSAAARADSVDPQLLGLMRKAGCRVIFYGLECANNKILKFMHKGITVEQMVRAVEMTKNAGIYPTVSIMFGQPGETFDDFFHSLQVALTSINCEDPVPYDASIMPLLTLPGTEIYRYAKQHRYFASDEDYWHKYAGSYRVPYNMDQYTNEDIGQAVDMVKTIYHWKYHQTTADNLLRSLRSLRSSYCESHRENLRGFLDRCLNDLMQYPPEPL